MSRSASTADDVLHGLRLALPETLAQDLLDDFLTLKTDVVTETLGRASPGKFVETPVQVLQWLDVGKWDAAPKVGNYLKQLESRPTRLAADLKLGVARIARGMYTLRNKRNIAHKGDVDPNVGDLRYLYAAAQWILTEIFRHALQSDVATADYLIRFIQLPVDPLVEDFGHRRLVLAAETANEEILLLLAHYYPERASSSQLHKDMDRYKAPTVSNAIRRVHQLRLVDGDRSAGFKLTALGYRQATELARKRSALATVS